MTSTPPDICALPWPRLAEPPTQVDADFAQAWPPFDAIASAIARAPRPEGAGLLGELGAPAADVCATALTTRAAILAMQAGRAFFHHELRARLPVLPSAEPEVEVWEHGPVPVWRGGVLSEPKYFSFFQDAPLPSYHPNHRGKWRPHELLHGAVGFFWRPDMSRFEAYLGARLGELVPVVHWYALDEIGRPRCPEHAGAPTPPRRTCPACERAAKTPYWEREPPSEQEAQQWLVRAREHFDEEWRACWAEIETGQRRPTPRPGLDASGDAVGYLRGHWPRLTSWSFGAWVERFCIEGVDHASVAAGYARRVARASWSLLTDPLRVERRRFEALRTRRVLQDAARRALRLAGWARRAHPGAERELDAALDPMAQRCISLTGDGARLDPEGDRALLAELGARIGYLQAPADARGPSFWALGHTWLAPSGSVARAHRVHLAEGLESATPTTALALAGAERDLELLAGELLVDPIFVEPVPLADRFARWLDARGEGQIAELARLEAWLQAAPRRDEPAERFAQRLASLDELDGPGQLRLHATARRGRFDAEVLEALLGQPMGAGDLEVLAAVDPEGALVVLPVDAPIEQALSGLEAGQPPRSGPGAQALAELLELGVCVWVPGVRPR